jgi:ATP-dependent DNA helicase RecG
MPDSSSTTLSLATPIQFLPGVGPDRADLFTRLGIRNGRDALFFFPRDYEPPVTRSLIADLCEQRPASIVGRVVEIDQRVTHTGRTIAGILVEDPSGCARLMFFNQAFRAELFHRGDLVLVTGTPRISGLRFEFVHPKVKPLEEDQEIDDDRPQPIYPLTDGLKQSAIRRVMKQVSAALADSLVEVLPDAMREQASLLGIAETIRTIHDPADLATLEIARRRLIFQELLVQQLALALRRRRLTTDLRSPPLPATSAINAAIKRRFPFRLTTDQETAITEVARDMARQFPMNRLIQGDVGSGKTVVAQYAMMLAVAHRHQAVLMAPTEILAQQHARTFNAALADSRVRIGLLTGSVKAAERKETLLAAANGQLDLIIGTHALLYGGIELPKLGLVVIDEQHKFGVNQRARLRGDGIEPHYLVMSATPIPRTVAMTMFGDLEVSTLREKPPGRGLVKTYLAKDGWRDRWWRFVADRLDEGRQAFVVAPLVDSAANKSDGLEQADTTDESASAIAVYEDLRKGPLKDYRIGLLHGRMPAEEKIDVMRRFAEGRIQVLIATTVIEVGIDVPNATVMTILGAQRFGLAQLHQLRGRINRGKHVGHIGVFTDGPGAPEENQRLQVLAETDDGFALAEADFQMRGPGDLLGTRQSGLPPLKIANPLRDAEILAEARKVAQTLIDEDPHLESEGYERLKHQVMHRYGKVLDLGDVA